MHSRDRIRRTLAGGGALTLAMVVVLLAIADVPTAPAQLLPIAWFGVGGALVILAGRRDRLSLGTVRVGWPRVAAVGLALLAIGSSTLGFVQLLVGTGGWGLAQAAISLLVSFVLAVGALECLLGGVAIDEDAFDIESPYNDD
ncbi:hypothetical protein D8Y22_15910 [Salinadaptatus halalkaliphilus]|uniref:Uncharacterized protein n=1 Tax=Salinadaptatus halalkaliphilus TaxID=2419781 RepID=A0A4S3TL21_9EURY|nr:hypothetical protein [Salinadaptatus halalkaliphilus]THE63933.1 hypothetical protein D8Y22_15910 [Salinadaptatus halalkaliphilus]